MNSYLWHNAATDGTKDDRSRDTREEDLKLRKSFMRMKRKLMINNEREHQEIQNQGDR